MANRIDGFLKNVFFIFILDAESNEKMIGTGFIVSMKIENANKYSSTYFVTAKHVIVNAKKYQTSNKLPIEIYTRFNLKTGKSKKYRLNLDAWKYDESDASVDVAIYEGGNLPKNIDYRSLDINMAVTKTMLRSRLVAEGDEVFFIGLFNEHSGKIRNQPIVRTGNIASLPRERVESKQFGSIEAHLIEARSLGGLSGSPVFVYYGTQGINEDFEVIPKNIKWFGLAQGHWDTKSPDSEFVNMGIGLVVPAHKVVGILRAPNLKKIRADAYKKVTQQN